MKHPTAVVADLKNCQNEAQVYVILSRAQRLSQIFIIGQLHEKKWYASKSALAELQRCETKAYQSRLRTFESCLDIISLNVLSLQKHFIDVQKYLQCHRLDPDVICLQETWLHENCNTTQYDLHCYDLNVNSVGRGRGIATYSRNEFIFEANISRTDIQITKVKSNEFTVINVYRSEGCDDLETHLSSLLTDPENTIVCGDINIDLKKSGPKQTKLMKFLKDFNLKQVVSDSTHEKGGLLDHVYVNEKIVEKVKITKKSIRFSDHDIICISIKK